MVRYFFDIYRLGRNVRDIVGMDIQDDTRAIHEATLIVEQLAEDARAEGRSGTILVSIRSDKNVCLYEASTSLARD